MIFKKPFTRINKILTNLDETNYLKIEQRLLARSFILLWVKPQFMGLQFTRNLHMIKRQKSFRLDLYDKFHLGSTLCNYSIKLERVIYELMCESSKHVKVRVKEDESYFYTKLSTNLIFSRRKKESSLFETLSSVVNDFSR